jgi:hypothetical protein
MSKSPRYSPKANISNVPWRYNLQYSGTSYNGNYYDQDYDHDDYDHDDYDHDDYDQDYDHDDYDQDYDRDDYDRDDYEEPLAPGLIGSPWVVLIRQVTDEINRTGAHIPAPVISKIASPIYDQLKNRGLTGMDLVDQAADAVLEKLSQNPELATQLKGQIYGKLFGGGRFHSTVPPGQETHDIEQAIRQSGSTVYDGARPEAASRPRIMWNSRMRENLYRPGDIAEREAAARNRDLEEAAERGHGNIVEALIQRGSTVYDGARPEAASRPGDIAEREAAARNRALVEAAERGHGNIVEALIQRGANLPHN